MNVDVYEIIKNDLINNPQKRNNMQFCLACYAYGIDLDQMDKELSEKAKGEDFEED